MISGVQRPLSEVTAPAAVALIAPAVTKQGLGHLRVDGDLQEDGEFVTASSRALSVTACN
jgi:hypothetical protein